HSLGVLLLDAPHEHAEMRGLDDHADALREERIVERLGDLSRQPLLDLEAAAEHLDEARQLREAKDLPVRNVRDVRLAEEGQEMMLAQRVEVDVLDQHHLVVVVFRENRPVQDLADILLVARREEVQHRLHAGGCLLQPLALGVLAKLPQDAFDQLLHSASPVASYSKRLFSVSTTATRASRPGGSWRSIIR